MAKKNLVCWSCGQSLKDVPRPIRRFTACPQCRAELHVCLMCEHHDRHYIGECSHDRADRVMDKTAANYCTYYVPRPDAYAGGSAAAPGDASRGALDALFGLEGAPADGAAEDPAATRERARAELEALFDVKKDEDARRR